jgi:hypothetical protein
VENRRLVHTKSRVGEEGAKFPFALEHIHLGRDAKGRDYGAARVLLLNHPVPEAGRKVKLASGEVSYLDAFETVFDKAVVVYPFGANESPVKAVRQELIREEFYATYTAKLKEGGSPADAKRQAFNRAQKGLVEKKLLCARDMNGIVQVWKADKKANDGTPYA